MIYDKQIRASHEALSPIWPPFLDYISNNQAAVAGSLASDPQVHMEIGSDRYPLQPWPMFVSGPKLRELQDASVAIPKLVSSIPARFFGNDPEQIAAYFGKTHANIESQLTSGKPHMGGYFFRSDFMIGPAGIRCLEVNCSSVLGGWESKIRERMYFQSPLLVGFRQQAPFSGGCRDPLRSAMEYMIRHTLEQVAPSGKTLNLGFAVLSVEVNNSVPQFMNALYRQVLGEVAPGWDGRFLWITFEDLEEKQSRLFYRGLRIHGILDYTYTMGPDPVIEAMKAGTATFYNAPVSVYLTDKRCIALISEHRDSDLFTVRERRVIDRYLPWTRRLLEERKPWKDENLAFPEALLQNPEAFVIKKGQSLGGTHVVVGCQTPPDVWEKKVREALEDGTWVVQEYLTSSPYLFHDPDLGFAAHDAIWGIFAFGEIYGGGFIRVACSQKSEGIINSSRGASESIICEVDTLDLERQESLGGRLQ